MNNSVKIKTEKLMLYILIPILTIGSIAIIFCTRLSVWIQWSLLGGVSVVGIASLLFLLFHWKKTYKILFLTLVLCFTFLIIYVFLEKTGFMNIFNVPAGPEKKSTIQRNMQAYLHSKGKWAILMYIILQFAQTTILPLPAFAVTGAGAVLFTQQYGAVIGPLFNAAMSLIGVVLGSLVAFYLGRLFGYKLVAWIIGNENLKKALTLIKGRDTVILTLMFLLPFFPDDLLCFVAGLSSMSSLYFIIMMIVSRILVVISTSYFVGLVPFNTWWGLTIWGIIFVATVICFIIAIKYGKKIKEFFDKKFSKHRQNDRSFDFAEKLIAKIDADIQQENQQDQIMKRRKHKKRHVKT